jgi:hypothetical protein
MAIQTFRSGKNSINRVNSNSFTQSPPPSPSRIPINNPEVLKWKQKYEEAEQKRKTILTEKEKSKCMP